jgi:cobyrinic acid a,c-diamide synthase
MARFLVSAASKSSGKTSVSVGLCAALSRRGLTVQPFKKGPDYIDPLWLGRAAGRPCCNLDFQVQSTAELHAEFVRHGGGADVLLAEGNKGLYDGLDLEGSNSNAALAHLLDLPVVLVLDTRGTIRGVAPLLIGYRQFDPGLKLAGVVLNFVGGSRHESKLRAVIEHYTDVPVLGALPRDDALTIGERHLGLVPANEAETADARIAALGVAIERHLDLGVLLERTAAPPLPVASQTPSISPETTRGRRRRAGAVRHPVRFQAARGRRPVHRWRFSRDLARQAGGQPRAQGGHPRGDRGWSAHLRGVWRPDVSVQAPPLARHQWRDGRRDPGRRAHGDATGRPWLRAPA